MRSIITFRRKYNNLSRHGKSIPQLHYPQVFLGTEGFKAKTSQFSNANIWFRSYMAFTQAHSPQLAGQLIANTEYKLFKDGGRRL